MFLENIYAIYESNILAHDRSARFSARGALDVNEVSPSPRESSNTSRVCVCVHIGLLNPA